MAVVKRSFWPVGTNFSGRCHCGEVSDRCGEVKKREKVWNVRRDKKSGHCGEVTASGGSTVIIILIRRLEGLKW